MKAQKLKRAVIKEEFVALTGNCERAVILNQFDYWSHRTDDIDAYIEEEIARQQNPEAINILEKAKTNGWIYKSTKELLEEIMLSISQKTARRHLITLVEHGWLQERDNPDNKWDKRKQYRYNLAKVQKDLRDLNYPLEGWTIITNQFDESKGHGVQWEGHGVPSEVHHDASNTSPKPTPAFAPTLAEGGPEITTEITTETHHPDENFLDDDDDFGKNEQDKQIHPVRDSFSGPGVLGKQQINAVVSTPTHNPPNPLCTPLTRGVGGFHQGGYRASLGLRQPLSPRSGNSNLPRLGGDCGVCEAKGAPLKDKHRVDTAKPGGNFPPLNAYMTAVEAKLSALHIRQALSSLESPNVAEMHKAGVPLDLLLQTIDTVAQNSKRKIQSFNFFKDAIWEAFDATSQKQKDRTAEYDATKRLIERLK